MKASPNEFRRVGHGCCNPGSRGRFGMMPMMLAEWRTKMRWPKIGLFLLSLLSLLAIPPSAQALEVVFCVPFCLGVGADTQTLILRGPDVPSVVSGVIT